MAPPPEGWGPAGFEERLQEAWLALQKTMEQPALPWLRIREGRGVEAVKAAYLQLLDGRADPREGLMLAF